MDEAINTFIAEASELLEVLESDLLKIGDEGADKDLLDEIFRCAHTIKGSAGLFGFDDIVHFTHDVENILDRARDREITIDKTLLSHLLKSRDYISELVSCIENDHSPTQSLLDKGEQITQQLSPWINSSDDQELNANANSEQSRQDKGVWHISLKLGRDALKNGMDPVSIIRYLSTIGEIVYIEVIDEALPVEQFDGEDFFLGFEFGLETDKDKSEIDDAFVFVRDDANIKMVPPKSSIKKYIELIKESATGDQRLGEILVRCGAITQTELDKALNTQSRLSSREGRPPLGEVLIAEQATQNEVVSAAIEAQVGKRPTKPRFIRVDSNRLDALINLIGETVINHQKVELISARLADAQLQEAVTEIQTLTEQVRDAALILRMVPIGETFQKFRRIVRDVADTLGKPIKLELFGEETELDRSMVEKISDPLTHLVRNAIDHGIEKTDIRTEKGKPKVGTLTLNAFHDSGNVVITISDDGGGLNTQRIREKALQAQLIQANETLSASEIHQLIFHPGFSTAEAVTNLSGRGVGMDVVKRNIEELQGSIAIDSDEGIGTTITIRLPLTLAIIDGFHVSASGTDFIVPHNAIVECLDFDSTQKIEGGKRINLRGELVPFIELKEIFSLKTATNSQQKLLIVKFANHQAGILVDELMGELQTVVKPLNPLFSALRGIGGSSLLGSGAIAFILDIPQLIALAVRKEVSITSNENVHNE